MGTKREELGLKTLDEILSESGLTASGVMTVESVLSVLNERGFTICKVKSGGCLGKAHPDEPLFILRAHDTVAPLMVKQWARHAAMLNSEVTDHGTETKPDIRVHVKPAFRVKHDEALQLAAAMEKWHDRKIPD
jgi:hypothetical protein